MVYAQQKVKVSEYEFLMKDFKEIKTWMKNIISAAKSYDEKQITITTRYLFAKKEVYKIDYF